MLNSNVNMQQPSFKGIYKYKVDFNGMTKDEIKAADMLDASVICEGWKSSVAHPKTSEKENAIYFKIDNRKNNAYEENFKKVLNECNQKFNVDLAKKVYLEKVGEDEYNKASIPLRSQF